MKRPKQRREWVARDAEDIVIQDDCRAIREGLEERGNGTPGSQTSHDQGQSGRVSGLFHRAGDLIKTLDG